MERKVRYGSAVNIGGEIEVRVSYTGRLYYSVQGGMNEEVKHIGDRVRVKTAAGMVFMTFLDRSAVKQLVGIKITKSRKKEGVKRRRKRQGAYRLRHAADAQE